MRKQSGHDAGAGRGANRLRYIRVFEDEALVRQRVKVWHLDPIVAVAGHRVATLLVAEDENDVRFLRHEYPAP